MEKSSKQWLCVAWALCGMAARAADPAVVRYRLPTDGALPRTYLVTLAVTERTNPDWIVSTFVAGQPRTVTTENDGLFTETWDGLDENFMPVPPGAYGVKGVYSPASVWEVDGEWHAITAQFVLGFSAWLPSPDAPAYWKTPVPFGGDPVNSPFRDVDVGPNGVAAFYYQYLENGRNLPMFDLARPIGMEQFLRAFPSGGAGGGHCVATDGDTVWACSGDGGPTFVYRADGKPFGEGGAAHRRNVYLPEGHVTAMAAGRGRADGQSVVYVAQRGRFVVQPPAPGRKYGRYTESASEFVNRVTVHDGADGTLLGSIDVDRPCGLAARGGWLYALHQGADGARVSRVALEDGLPVRGWHEVLRVPASLAAADLEVDRTGRIYLSDRAANKVYQFSDRGKPLLAFGRLDRQEPGSYDPLTLMSPAKLATWTDATGKDRLLICEEEGPNRVSEWDADRGELVREFPSYQTKCNNGYAFDPDDPGLVYLPTQGDWLTRFRVDYGSRTWRPDAVWPGVRAGQRNGLDKPVAIRARGTLYFASEQNLSVYRMTADGKRCVSSAGIVQRDKAWFFWNDANDNGACDDEELRPTELPGHVLTYHGQKWLPDFTYLAMGQGSRDVWRLTPSSFDAHGNPVFMEWTKVLTDPIFAARAAGTADAIHGGNELADTYNSDWMQADGSVDDGLYVHARGGKNFTANFGAQYKVSRYVPDGQGGYRLRWRVGRAKLGPAGIRGELEGGMRLFKPINGLLAVVDQSRSGVFLYTEDGLYVDTLFPPGWTRDEIGVYRQPGEFFAGTVVANPKDGRIYYASGKYTPMFYAMRGWSLTENPVRALPLATSEVTVSAAQVADPPEIAVSLRGGPGAARVARFLPALGGVALDGSLNGWETAETVAYRGSPDQSVEVRCLYDADHLHLRWHLRLGSTFEPKPLPPLERIFTHDHEADAVSLYFQGDVDAPAGDSSDGRAGDVRMVFGLFQRDGAPVPVAVGMYPTWGRPGGQPQRYRSPVGQVAFEHVAAVEGASLGASIDSDRCGFVLAASIPRTAVPAMVQPFAGRTRTRVNFDATFGGRNRFWWANTDGSASRETYDEPSEARLYPGSWAPAVFEGLDAGVPVRRWLVAGPFGGLGAERFTADPRNKDEVRKYYEAAHYPPEEGPVDPGARFGDEVVRGYWRDPGTVRWRTVGIEAMDTRVELGGGSQTWFGAAWIHCPEDVTFDAAFQGHKMTPLRWRVNGDWIGVPERAYAESRGAPHRLGANQPLALRKGWNEVLFRGYNVGYAPFRVGLVLRGDESVLWKLKFAAVPPAGP